MINQICYIQIHKFKLIKEGSEKSTSHDRDLGVLKRQCGSDLKRLLTLIKCFYRLSVTSVMLITKNCLGWVLCFWSNIYDLKWDNEISLILQSGSPGIYWYINIEFPKTSINSQYVSFKHKRHLFGISVQQSKVWRGIHEQLIKAFVYMCSLLLL